MLAACGGDRQAEVAARGAEVMPFDLDRTEHVFEKQPGGGIQLVLARDSTDTLTIRLVREHLREESARFARGDFADPGAIHGDDMPGLAELRGGAGRISVEYDDQAAGGRIRYATGDSALVAALHRWFDAQVRDHGAHARH